MARFHNSESLKPSIRLLIRQFGEEIRPRMQPMPSQHANRVLLTYGMTILGLFIHSKSSDDSTSARSASAVIIANVVVPVATTTSIPNSTKVATTNSISKPTKVVAKQNSMVPPKITTTASVIATASKGVIKPQTPPQSITAPNSQVTRALAAKTRTTKPPTLPLSLKPPRVRPQQITEFPSLLVLEPNHSLASTPRKTQQMPEYYTLIRLIITASDCPSTSQESILRTARPQM